MILIILNFFHTRFQNPTRNIQKKNSIDNSKKMSKISFSINLAESRRNLLINSIRLPCKAADTLRQGSAEHANFGPFLPVTNQLVTVIDCTEP